MPEAGTGFVCGPRGCQLVSVPAIDMDDPGQRWLMQQFGEAYQAAVQAKRDPGNDHEVLRLMALITTGPGQMKLPGF